MCSYMLCKDWVILGKTYHMLWLREVAGSAGSVLARAVVTFRVRICSVLPALPAIQ